MSSQAEFRAVLRGVTPPDENQKERLLAFLKRRYGGDFTLEWVLDESVRGGFVLEAGADVYDWSLEGRMRQLRERMDSIKASAENVIPLIREAAESWTPRLIPEEIGHVDSVGDQIATVSGPEKAAYGEILLFPSGVKGMVQELREDSLGCILFGGDEEVSEGSEVRRSGKVAGIPVGDAFLGRVIDALGSPIDGRGEIFSEEYRPIEAAAPQIIDRKPVDRPLETGILAIDSMFPIGRGQRLGHAAIHRALRGLRAGRVFHGQGPRCTHRLRRPLQARHSLPCSEPAAGALARARGISGRRILPALQAA